LENELKAKEAILAEQIKKMETIRSNISQIQENQKREDSEKISKLMETLVTMSPKAAAKVISSIDEKLAVAIMLKTDNQRLAKILNVMDAKNSTRLSEALAGVNKKNE
jgi:flagellar motility protein MotE (MotC chaperone)